MQPAETIADLDIERHALDSLDSAEWTWAHWKAILVAGSGFLTDSYDNFVISLMVPMIAYTYYGSSSLPSFEDGWIKAASSYGNLVGQLLFGYLGDILGRKKIYGVELMILIVGAIGCALAAQPAKGISLLANLGFWRFILGIGVGGDYPASGVITAEFASSKNRGTMVALVFAMQGVGIMLGAIVSVLTLLVMKSSIEADTQNLDYCWRFVAGFGVVPALLAVYYRLTITETPRFTMHVKKNKQKALQDVNTYLSNDNAANPKPAEQIKGKVNVSKNHRQTFMTYFSTWPHLKILIACSVCWFLLDIGYYGTNLNTSVVLSAIGFSDKSTPFRFVWNTAVGQLIIAICGNVPGYWFTVHFVDKWGRKPIQLMGFAALTICFAVLAAAYDFWKASAVPGFIVIYSLAQFFFNFGPNTTTFIYPTEVFPTAVRSTGHGISAASGKLGALIAAQIFSLVADFGGAPGQKKFMAGVLAIFSVLCFLGGLTTLLLPETMGLTLEEICGEESESSSADSMSTVDDSRPDYTQNQLMNDAQ